MASYLRPRRGKKATAESQNIVLKKGEVFFEVPTGGVGKGIGKIKMGDGTTAYNSLPYFLEQKSIDVANTTIAFTTNSSTDNTTLLNAIASGAKLNVIVGAIKKLLTQLNNDLKNVNSTKMIGFPNYSTVLKTINTPGASYTATQNCWVIGLIRINPTTDSGTISSAIVYVNGILVAVCGMDSGSTNIYGEVCVPVKAGDVITTRNVGYYDIKVYAVS